MKLFNKFFISLTVLIIAAVCLTACGSPVTLTDTEVVFTVSTSVMSDLEGKTVIDYMDKMVADGDLTYVVENGMITKIGDLAQDAAANKWWMIYTDDAENGNSDWGTYVYNEKTFYSATKGAGELPAKEGCAYIFVLIQF